MLLTALVSIEPGSLLCYAVSEICTSRYQKCDAKIITSGITYLVNNALTVNDKQQCEMETQTEIDETAAWFKS